MNASAKTLLSSVVGDLRSVPARLSGEDSPLADPWEEIKDQLQQELSLYWPAYLDTMKAMINSAVDRLTSADLLVLSAELRVLPEDRQRLCEVLLRRLLAKAKREKVRYAPFDFEHCRFSIDGMCIYSQIIERTGLYTCQILAFSSAAPSGERGEINTDMIESVITAEDFERARGLNWPETWEDTK